jgi:2,3-bisphosphoglycerate-dependent phosphoglycerate mutase
MKYALLLFFICSIANSLCAQATSSLRKNSRIYIVRHAEKQTGKDPLLTEEGNNRAGDLLRELKNKKIKRMYVTEYKRTQHTADSLHLQMGIDTIQIIADTSCTALFSAITKNKDWNKPILVVTHSNIIQKIIYKLGITDFPQQNIPDNEFDNLYLVSVKNKKPELKHTKYGKPSATSATMMQR